MREVRGPTFGQVHKGFNFWVDEREYVKETRRFTKRPLFIGAGCGGEVVTVNKELGRPESSSEYLLETTFRKI